MLISGHGFALEFNESKFIIPIPNKRRVTKLIPFPNRTRDTLIYMMTLFLNPLEEGLSVIESNPPKKIDWALIPAASLAPEALSIFKEASRQENSASVFELLKNLLATKPTLNARHLHHSRFPVPENVNQLQSQFSYRSWNSEVIEVSSVKGTQRIIYRSPNHLPEISISETHVIFDDTVRETELIIPRENLSGQFDFFAYDQKGLLTQTSLFQSQNGKKVSAPVPYACLTCHYDGAQGVFQRNPVSPFLTGRHK
ncbi:MAG: hypothetical protein EXR74_04400 [Bdellovibrionales bacterium]|nr:hypothetical protein [Bdellovibrionales bacterium]